MGAVLKPRPVIVPMRTLSEKEALAWLVGRGRIETSMTKLASDWRWGTSKVKRHLDRWSAAGCIQVHPGLSGRTMITALPNAASTPVVSAAAVLEGLTPPDAPLPPSNPAARFRYSNGRFDVAPTGAWRDRQAQANIYHARAQILATDLAKRLSRTDAVPDVASSVATLVDLLGTSVAEVQPDLLRLASRSIAAKARAYGHPAAQWEISADSVSSFFELADVLVDLQTFVKADLEAHEQAIRDLDPTPEKAADAKVALDILTRAILSSPEVISERTQTAFEAAAEVSSTAADRDVKVAVEGDRTLLAGNLALAVARELGRDKEASSTPDEHHAEARPWQNFTPGARDRARAARHAAGASRHRQGVPGVPAVPGVAQGA
jgi:hypothetical protein